jgi:hypothetical protein
MSTKFVSYSDQVYRCTFFDISSSSTSTVSYVLNLRLRRRIWRGRAIFGSAYSAPLPSTFAFPPTFGALGFSHANLLYAVLHSRIYNDGTKKACKSGVPGIFAAA